MVDNSSPALERRSTMGRICWPYVKPEQMGFAQKCSTGSGGSGEESAATSSPSRHTHAHTHVCTRTGTRRPGSPSPLPLKGFGEGLPGPDPGRPQELVRSHRGRSTGLSFGRFKCDSWPSLQPPCVIRGSSVRLIFPICAGKGTAPPCRGAPRRARTRGGAGSVPGPPPSALPAPGTGWHNLGKKAGFLGSFLTSAAHPNRGALQPFRVG